jgi:hypothetical protein
MIAARNPGAGDIAKRICHVSVTGMAVNSRRRSTLHSWTANAETAKRLSRFHPEVRVVIPPEARVVEGVDLLGAEVGGSMSADMGGWVARTLTLAKRGRRR